MPNYIKAGHTVYDIKFHIVWITKYRYKILKGNIAQRLVALLKQGCETKDIEIIKGHVSQDHVHMLISVPPNLSVSDVARYLKGRSSHLLQDECLYGSTKIFIRSANFTFCHIFFHCSSEKNILLQSNHPKRILSYSTSTRKDCSVLQQNSGLQYIHKKNLLCVMLGLKIYLQLFFQSYTKYVFWIWGHHTNFILLIYNICLTFLQLDKFLYVNTVEFFSHML